MPAVTIISVEKELEKYPEIKFEDIKNIREWLTTQPHLPRDHITDLDIILAYHSCQRNVDETKKVIDHNFSLRSLFSFYQDRKIDSSLKNALQTWLIAPLRTPMAGTHRAVYCQLLDADTEKFVYRDVVRAFMMVMDLWQLEEGTAPGVAVLVNMDRVALGHLKRIDLVVAQEFFYFLQVRHEIFGAYMMKMDLQQLEEGTAPGVDVLGNMDRVALRHLKRIDLVVAQEFFYFLQEAMFVRLKEFHFINAPSFIDRLLSMIKPFMKEDFMHKLKIHTVGSNTLDEYINIIDFLKEIGELSVGDNKNKTWTKLKENNIHFEEESKKRVDESKRPGKKLTMANIFSGMETTFRSLQID